jgi:hypothetical protein
VSLQIVHEAIDSDEVYGSPFGCTILRKHEAQCLLHSLEFKFRL